MGFKALILKAIDDAISTGVTGVKNRGYIQTMDIRYGKPLHTKYLFESRMSKSSNVEINRQAAESMLNVIYVVLSVFVRPSAAHSREQCLNFWMGRPFFKKAKV